MRYLFFLFAVGLILTSCNDCPEPTAAVASTDSVAAPDPEPEGYDSTLAAQYGADQYGMKLYVMAFLKEGPNRDLDSTAAAELQAAHMANIGRMAEEGKLLLAGPFGPGGDLRGIYIFDVRTVEEAKTLTETDPAIQAGSLEMELKLWYGSAAVMAINDLHGKVAKVNI